MSEKPKMLGMRFCRVLEREKAMKLSKTLGPEGLGLPLLDVEMPEGMEGFQGAIFPVAGQEKSSWIEVWPAGQEMPEMIMLQIVVDDADKLAEQARANGLDPKGPDDAHGERIYYLEGPGGLPIAFLSKLDD